MESLRLLKCIVICYMLTFIESISPSCSEYFQYKLEEHDWIGEMTIPSLPLGVNMSVSTEFTISVKPETQYFGHIELVPPKEEYIHDIIAGRPLRYKVYFPLPQPIPHLTRIIVNDETICRNQPDLGLTFILRYTLVTQLAEYCFRKYPSVEEAWKCINKWSPLNPISDICTYLPRTCKRLTLVQKKPDVVPTTQPPPITYRIGELSDTCGVSNTRPNNLTRNAEISAAGDWPWMVAIYIINNKEINFVCAGNLIAPKIVITAAHCIYGEDERMIPTDTILLILGRHNLDDWTDGAVFPEVESVISHPEYRGRFISLDADIALLLLKTQVEFNVNVRPLCLWNGTADLGEVVGMEAVLSGWGQGETSQYLRPFLRVTKVPIVSQETCASSREEFMHLISNRTLCAGFRNGGGPCHGDSGGGLVLWQNERWTLRGIVSRSLTSPDAQCNFNEYIIFTDAAKFSNWIMKYISE